VKEEIEREIIELDVEKIDFYDKDLLKRWSEPPPSGQRVKHHSACAIHLEIGSPQDACAQDMMS